MSLHSGSLLGPHTWDPMDAPGPPIPPCTTHGLKAPRWDRDTWDTKPPRTWGRRKDTNNPQHPWVPHPRWVGPRWVLPPCTPKLTSEEASVQCRSISGELCPNCTGPEHSLMTWGRRGHPCHPREDTQDPPGVCVSPNHPHPHPVLLEVAVVEVHAGARGALGLHHGEVEEPQGAQLDALRGDGTAGASRMGGGHKLGG